MSLFIRLTDWIRNEIPYTVRYALIGVLNLAIATGIYWLLSDVGGIPAYQVTLLIAVPWAIYKYLTMRWVFKKSELQRSSRFFPKRN